MQKYNIILINRNGVDIQIKIKQNEKAITLIALVISIVILLILSGITLNILFGDDGILNSASKTKNDALNKSIKEQRESAKIDASYNNELTEYKEIIDGKEIIVPIPAGFARTNIDGESKIDEGMVIIDEEGNEFVWIPCTLDEYENADTRKILEEGDYSVNVATGFLDKNWIDLQSNDSNIKNSIRQYKGFYVARYEAGIPEYAKGIYANKDGAEYQGTDLDRDYEKNPNGRNVDKYIPVSKQGVQAWNFISQENAEIISKNMVQSSSAQSYLIDSHAWNVICKKIENNGKSISDSTEYGNYRNNETVKNLNTFFAVHKTTNGSDWLGTATEYNKGIINQNSHFNENESGYTYMVELETGASEDFKTYNIYDMAGNMYEWTTEVSSEKSSSR